MSMKKKKPDKILTLISSLSLLFLKYMAVMEKEIFVESFNNEEQFELLNVHANNKSIYIY